MLRIRSIDQSRILIKDVAAFIDRKDVFSVMVVIITAFGAFFIGRLSYIESSRAPVTIEQFLFERPEVVQDPIAGSTITTVESIPPEPNIKPKKGIYVGSRTSNKYHLPTCPGAGNIAESNKVWFASKEEAKNAGYVPAANCKGI